MANTGMVRILNFNPYSVYLTINGQVIPDKVPGMQDDGSPGQLSNSGKEYDYPFPRLPVPSIDGAAQFVTSNIVEVSGKHVKDITYDVKIYPTEIDIFENLTLCLFNEMAALVAYGEGKVVTDTLLVPS